MQLLLSPSKTMCFWIVIRISIRQWRSRRLLLLNGIPWSPLNGDFTSPGRSLGVYGRGKGEEKAAGESQRGARTKWRESELRIIVSPDRSRRTEEEYWLVDRGWLDAGRSHRSMCGFWCVGNDCHGISHVERRSRGWRVIILSNFFQHSNMYKFHMFDRVSLSLSLPLLLFPESIDATVWTVHPSVRPLVYYGCPAQPNCCLTKCTCIPL